jgi:hypothetical protein
MLNFGEIRGSKNIQNCCEAHRLSTVHFQNSFLSVLTPKYVTKRTDILSLQATDPNAIDLPLNESVRTNLDQRHPHR